MVWITRVFHIKGASVSPGSLYIRAEDKYQLCGSRCDITDTHERVYSIYCQLVERWHVNRKRSIDLTFCDAAREQKFGESKLLNSTTSHIQHTPLQIIVHFAESERHRMQTHKA